MRIPRIAISVAFAAGPAALGRQGAILSPLLAASTVLADLRGGRRSRYRHDNHQRAAPSAHGGATLLLPVLRAAARLPTAGLLRAGISGAAELFWATMSPPVSRRWHNGGRNGGEIVSGRAFPESSREEPGAATSHRTEWRLLIALDPAAREEPGAATPHRTGAKLQGSVHGR